MVSDFEAVASSSFSFPFKIFSASFFCSKNSSPPSPPKTLWKMAAPMSDVSGYRSDGGGLGQDQGVSKQLRSILTAKLPLLSAPGTVLENSLYYDINSSSVTAVEEQATFNKDRITLNNLTIGSTPSAYIPSVLFANSVFWIVQLPELEWPTVNPVANATSVALNIPQGWGFAALQNILVYMGASSIAQIQISGMTNFLINSATCETFSKRTSMIEGAGRYINPLDNVSSVAGALYQVPAASLWRYKAYGEYFNSGVGLGTLAPAPWLRQAVVPIRLPWSSMAVLDKRLSMDTKLSTQPIQITLQTAQANQFIQAGSFWSAQLAAANFSQSTIQLWQEELSDKSLSVRNELLAMPEFNVGYPFQYAQSIPFQVTTSAADNGQLSTVFTLNITSIINSDLTTFLFNVTWNGRQDCTKNSGQYCPLYGEELLNVELLLNGQRFFAFDGDDYSYVTLAKQLDDPRALTIMPSVNTVTSVAATTGFQAKSNIYEFNNSRLRSIIAESHLQNTARFTNQTFQLSFSINRSKYYLAGYSGAVALTSGYQLNMTYLYNAVYLVGGDGGTTKLITN